MNHKPALTKIVTTLDILEAVRSQNIREGKPDSDYGIAKTIGISPHGVSSYLRGRTIMDDQIAVKASKALDWPIDQVIGCLLLERAKKLENVDLTNTWGDFLKEKKLYSALISVPFLVLIFSNFGGLIT